MTKYVITGSSGRVGRAIHFCLASSNEVIGLDLGPCSATSVVADIMDFDALRRAFEGATAVFHAAALHAPHVGLMPDDEFQRTNVDGTENAAKAALECGVPRFVLTSTTALYGHASQLPDRASWIQEDTEPQPRTIYHRTKIEAEKIVKDLACESLRVRVIRMSRCFPEPAPAMAVYRLHRGIDVRDAAAAHVTAASDSADSPFETYVVSGKTPFLPEDCELLKNDAAEVIRQRFPVLSNLFDERGWELPKTIDRVYDSRRARTRLGWEARFGPEEVLEQLDRMSFEVLPPSTEPTKENSPSAT